MAVLKPPVQLMLARAEHEVPESRPGREWAFEPKFDGWRCVLFAAAGVLQSRRDNNLASRFPEITSVVDAVGDVVLDGEIVALRDGRLDFGALPSSPQARAAAGAVVYFVAFDLLAEGGKDLRAEAYRVRRAQLERLFAGVEPPFQLAPSTTDRHTALTWMRPEVSAVGIEGCVAKLVDAAYRPGRTGIWVKVRQVAVVDAVVVGVTVPLDRPAEILLARPDDRGELRRIGLSMPLAPGLREEIGAQVTVTGESAVRVSTGAFGGGHTQYRPVVPELVVEVQAEASVVAFANRLRPRVLRLRPDLTVDDLEA